MENQNPRVPPLWEHSLTTLLGHDPTSDPIPSIPSHLMNGPKKFNNVEDLLDSDPT